MKTIYNKGGIRLINGETVSTLTKLARDGEQFDAMLTDPPYASGGLHIGSKSQSTTTKYQQTQTKKLFPSFGGDARSQLSWLTWCTVWLNASREILKPGAPVMMFCDWRQAAAAIQAVQAGGFQYRGLVPWDKGNGRPYPGGFRAQCEYIIFATNGKIQNKEVYMPGVFREPIPSRKVRRHATQKPIPLLTDLLKIVPEGGKVLDAFAGSGTTLHACRQRGLKGTAIEESRVIAADACAWLKEPVAT